MSLDIISSGSDPTSGEREELLGVINRQVRALDRLVGDLLDTARIEAGQLALKVDWVDVVRVANESVCLFRAISSVHQVILREENTGPLYCRGDAHRLGQVFNNIISNAIKYSPAGGEIVVRLDVQATDVVIEVRDKGVGISEDELTKIFLPFRRGRATRDTIPGVGIGLSVSKRIVEAHGGTLDVRSKVGEGSVFRVLLPLGREANAWRSATNALGTPRQPACDGGLHGLNPAH